MEVTTEVTLEAITEATTATAKDIMNPKSSTFILMETMTITAKPQAQLAPKVSQACLLLLLYRPQWSTATEPIRLSLRSLALGEYEECKLCLNSRLAKLN